MTDSAVLPDEDDFTHYFNATGRLSRENADLRTQLAESERLRKIATALLDEAYVNLAAVRRAPTGEQLAALDAIYVERYGITYRELERRVRDVQDGKFLTHEEAMQRIRFVLTSLPARPA